jgi:hypothetical protein
MQQSFRPHLVVIAATALVAWVALAGAPAGADSPAAVEGMLDIGDALPPFVIGEDDPGSPCEGSTAFDVDVDAGGTYTMTASAKIPFQVSGSASWYQLDLSLIGLTGATWTATGSPPPDFDLAGTFTWQLVVSQIDTSTCAKSALCTVRFRTVLVPPSGHDGTLPAPGAGDVTTLVGTTEITGGIRPVVTFGTCGVTLQQWFVGQPTTIDLGLLW